MYLIEKRGLYYRPESRGYTGLKSEAGRYSLDDVSVHFPNRESPNQDGMTFVSETDAPDYSTRCPWDVRMKDAAFKEGFKAGQAALATARRDARAEALRGMLAAYDGYMAGEKITAEQHETETTVARAASFAAAAYERGMPGGQNVHALARSFLLALIDPDHPDLDYLRIDPATGQTARDAADALRALIKKDTDR
jgi:hypothetical protein